MKNIKTKIDFIYNKIKNKIIEKPYLNINIRYTKLKIIIILCIVLCTFSAYFFYEETKNYKELSLSILNNAENSNNIASIRYANNRIPENNDLNIGIKDNTKLNSKVIYSKLKFKKNLEVRFGSNIDDISVENKELYISEIDDILSRVDSKSDKFSEITGELIAIKEFLNTIEPNNNSIKKIVGDEVEVELNSASLNDNSRLEEIKEKVKKANLEKEEVKIEDIIEKPVDEIKPSVLKENIIPETVKTNIITKIEPTPEPIPVPKPVVKVEPAPVPKPIPKPVVKVEPVPEPKPIPKPVVKVEPVPEPKPIPKPVVNNNNDAISISNNTKINSILSSLNTNIYDDFKLKTLKNNNIFLENGIWYTYIYSKYKNFGKGVIPSDNDLQTNGFNKESTLLLLDDTLGVSFVIDYKKVKLVSESIISGITNKNNFLKEVSDDKRYLHSDTDELFRKLKTETNNLTAGLSTSSKIAKIYDYILRNISYSKQFSTSDRKIFSGILTYKNKEGICGGYTKLNLYMLSFAGISDVQVIKGFVIDAPDFPSIGHAWVKIGYQYYDPTFDDPVGASKTKTYSEYKYYSMPSDIFYTNRYNYYSLPSYLKTESLESRKNLIKENLSKLVNKYESKNYVLLKSFVFRKNNNLTYNESITIEKLKKIIPNFEVNNYTFDENSETKTIKDLKYYTVSDSNITALLEQINYNLEGYKLLKWDDSSYRLAYKIELG